MKQHFEPADNQFRSRVEQSFLKQKFMHLIGAQLISVDPGSCEIHLPYGPDLTQQHGYFHAGIISTLADNAAGYAAYSLMSKTSSVLSVEFKINLMAPARGEMLIARSQVLKRGRTLTICRSEVFTIQDQSEVICAAAQATIIELLNTSDH